jgi:hypothetical protein
MQGHLKGTLGTPTPLLAPPLASRIRAAASSSAACPAASHAAKPCQCEPVGAAPRSIPSRPKPSNHITKPSHRITKSISPQRQNPARQTQPTTTSPTTQNPACFAGRRAASPPGRFIPTRVRGEVAYRWAGEKVTDAPRHSRAADGWATQCDGPSSGECMWVGRKGGEGACLFAR